MPVALFVILIPLHEILSQQTERAQLSDASESLTTAVHSLENYLSDIRVATNKMFNDDSYLLLAASDDDTLIGDSMTLRKASSLLGDLTYNMQFSGYSYVTFSRNHLVIDEYRFFDSYEAFYPGSLEYQDVTLEKWSEWQTSCEPLYLSDQTVLLNRATSSGTYLSIYQPFTNSSGYLRGSCTFLIREKDLIGLFLPKEKWLQEGVFFIVQDDGTVLTSYQCTEVPAVSGNRTASQKYNGEDFLFVSKPVPSMDASAVIGLPYSIYADNIRAVERVVGLYVGIGVTLCFLCSIVMTMWDVRQLRPILETLNNTEMLNARPFNDLIAQKLLRHNQLSSELARARGELDHSRAEALLKTGVVGSEEARRKMCEQMHLTEYNYLLLIPAHGQQDTRMGEELRLTMITERVRQNYGREQFVYNTAEGDILVILTLDGDTEAEQVRMCRRTELLHTQLELTRPLILSGRFTAPEQLSSLYWQARNALAHPGAESTGQKILYLRDEDQAQFITTDITSLDRLNEYLLSGHAEEALALVRGLFGVDALSAQNFQQTFFSVRGVLIAAAQKAGCEDVALLCTYDRQQSSQRLIRNLCDCCFEICSHIDSLKHSHNESLQRQILAWLDQQYANPDLNLSMTAAQFGISKKYVSQFLKEQTGKSFTEYVEDLRLTHAMEMLKTTDLSITELAARCGFSARNTFYKAFRRRYGISPSSVRSEAER